jgi:hypothetical protein
MTDVAVTESLGELLSPANHIYGFLRSVRKIEICVSCCGIGWCRCERGS